MIQSVDSLKLASETDRLAGKNGRIMDVLCEVNIGGEESRAEFLLKDLHLCLSRCPQWRTSG